MDKLKEELIKILFDNNKKQIDKFNSNKSFEIDNLSNDFLNILDVPYERIIIKNKNEIPRPNTLSRIIKQKSVTKNSIYKIVCDILKGKIKDKSKNKYRNLHPILIIIFFDLLEVEGYDFVKTINNTIEIRHLSYDINYRIRETLKIFITLFTNKNLITLLPELRIKMILNFTIDAQFNGINYDYIDIYIRILNQKILINIDNTKENYSDNFKNDSIVLAITNEILDHFYFNDMSTIDFMNIIYKRIAQKTYKKYISNSIAFYLTLHNIPIAQSLFFTKIYQSDGIKLKDLIKYLEDLGFNKCWNVFKLAIKKGDISNIHFNNCNIDINKNKKKLLKTVLNLEGITSLLNYPRKSDWELAPLIKNYYAIFTKEYFIFINNYLYNQNEKFKYLKEAYKINKKFKSIHEILKISIFNLLHKFINKDIEKKLNIKFHPTIFILVEEKGSKINKNNLLEKIYGLNLNINKNLKQHPDYNNELYLDLKYRIEQNESKEYIINYRLIEPIELIKIFNFF